MFLPDSEEEIFVSKKSKSKQVLQDSESEGEERGCSLEKTDTVAEDVKSGEEKEHLIARKNKKHRIRQALLDSDESDIGDTLDHKNLEIDEQSDATQNELDLGSQVATLPTSPKQYKKHKSNFEGETGKKAMGKSRRRRMEKEKKMEAIRELKKEKKRKQKV